MSAEMSIKSKFALMMRRSSDLTEEEKIYVRRISSRVVWFLAAAMGLFIGWGYISIFRDQPAGPPRDLLLEVCNAFTISLASVFVAARIVCLAARLKPTSSVPLAVLAGTIFFVGGNLLLDASMRLKADVAVAEVRSVALGKISELARQDQPISDVRGVVTEASEYVRTFRDPARMIEFHAGHDRTLRNAEDRIIPTTD